MATARQIQLEVWDTSLLLRGRGGCRVANKTLAGLGEARGQSWERGIWGEALKPWLWRRTQLPAAMTITPWIRTYSTSSSWYYQMMKSSKVWMVRKSEEETSCKILSPQVNYTQLSWLKLLRWDAPFDKVQTKTLGILPRTLLLTIEPPFVWICQN